MGGLCGSCTKNVNETLIQAAREGHDDYVWSLLETRPAVNAPNRDGDTALMGAAFCGRYQCLDMLIKAGANVNKRKKDGNTALMICAEGNYADCVDLLIRSGASVNISDSHGYTALMKASDNGYVKIVEMLLETGADVNGNRSAGVSSLMCAARNGFYGCVELLVKRGAHVNACDNRRRTALMHAAGFGQLDCVDLLIKAGADVNKADKYGETVVMKCVYNVDYTFVATCNHDNSNPSMNRYVKRRALKGENAFGYSGCFKCLKLLIQAGANVNDPHGNCCTALVDAITWREYNDAALLITSGAHVNTAAVADLNSTAGADVNLCDLQEHAILREAWEKRELSKLCLKYQCRETIRKHLMSRNPTVNLVLQVPILGLPALMTEYLIHGDESFIHGDFVRHDSSEKLNVKFARLFRQRKHKHCYQCDIC